MNEFFYLSDNIINPKVKIIIEEMFFQCDVNTLSRDELREYMCDIKQHNTHISDILIIEEIFKKFGKEHYYNSNIAFLIFWFSSFNIKEKEGKKETKTYLLKNPITGHFKIGKTTRKNINDRVKELSVGAELEIISFCNIDIEKKLHLKYKDFNVHREWFSLSDSHIKEIIDTFNLDINKLLER